MKTPLLLLAMVLLSLALGAVLGELIEAHDAD